MIEARNDAAFGASRGLPDNPFTHPTTGPTAFPPGGRPQGSGRGPDPVHIVSGEQQFFAAMRKALGFDDSGTKSFPGLEPIIKGQQAILAQTKQIADDLSKSAAMQVQIQTGQTALINTIQTAHQQQNQQMQAILTSVNNQIAASGQTAVQMQQAITAMTQAVTQAVSAIPAPAPTPTPTPTPTPGPGGGGGGNPRTRPNPSPYNPWTTRAGFATHMTRKHGAGSWQSRIARGFSAAGVGGALRATPYVGVAVAAGEQINNAATWLTDQTAENTRWSAMTGGTPMGGVGDLWGSLGAAMGGSPDADRSGLGQRIQQEGFVLGQRFSFGGLNEQAAREAFAGTTSLGYTGGRREEALDFIQERYRNASMTVQESMEILAVSAQHANASLSGVKQGLDQVTRAAVATGQNAQMLRQQFTANYANALGAGAGASSGALAQGWTMATAGMNRELVGMNYGAVLGNQGLMRLMAGSAGMSAGQLYSQLSRGDTGVFAAQHQRIINRNILGVLGQSVRGDLQRLVNQYGGNQEVGRSQAAQRSIALELMSNRNFNIDAARAALENSGIDTSQMTDPSQVAQAIVANMVGAGPEGQIAQAEGDHKVTSLSEDQANSILGGGRGDPFLLEFGAKIGEKKQGLGVFDYINEGFGGTDPKRNEVRALETNRDAYLDYRKNTKSANPAIEELLRKFGGNTDARVQVMTAQGPRVVHMSEAITHYSDQLSSGEAVIMGVGDESGKRVSEITGFRVGGDKTGDSTQRNAPVGMTVEEYQKQNPGTTASGEKSNGTVTISPSWELRKLFNFTSTGGVNIDGAASVGRPPVVPNR